MRRVPIRRQKKEVVLGQCPICKGRGSVKLEDSNELAMCLDCGGSGEVIKKRTFTKPIIRINPRRNK